MNDTIRGVLRNAARRPGKTALQAAVIAAGALAFSAGLAMAGSIQTLERETYRYRVSISAGETDEAGRFEYTRPSPFTADIIERLATETAFIKRAAPVNEVRWPAVRVGSNRFSIRSIVSAGADYAAVMGIGMASGRSYTKAESDNGDRVMLVSKSVAESLFGSVEGALGQSISAERGAMMVPRGSAGASVSRMSMEKYEIIGVYEDPSELARAALGVPDAIIPFGAERPPGLSVSPRIEVFVAETDGASPAVLEAKLREAMTTMDAYDETVVAWEGEPFTPNASEAAEARKVLSSLSGAIAGLGLLVLAASVFGIYSSTAMDAADGRKGTAIRRALGESALGTVVRFISNAAAFGAMAAVIGALLSIPAYKALAAAAESILAGAGLSEGGIFPALPAPWALFAAIAATAAACALFALPPAIAASKADVVEGLQEL